MRIYNERILSAVSLGADATSAVADMDHMGMASIHAIWTGTPTGTLSVQVSVNGVDWVAPPTALSVAIAGAAGQVVWTMPDLTWKAVRVIYVRTSGTGTVNAWVNAKGF
jgi:hypothetical protein